MLDFYKIRRNQEAISLQIWLALVLEHKQDLEIIVSLGDYNVQKRFFYHFCIIDNYLSIAYYHRTGLF